LQVEKRIFRKVGQEAGLSLYRTVVYGKARGGDGHDRGQGALAADALTLEAHFESNLFIAVIIA
jgi:hypothetical protein